MSSNQRRFYKTLLSLSLLPLMTVTTISLGINHTSALNISAKTPQLISQNLTGFIASIWERRPRRRNISRSGAGFCAIAPGLVDTYKIWHNKPVFLWNYQGKPEQMQLVVRDYDTQAIIWKQDVDISAQKLAYTAPQPLEAGKLYQWQLVGKTSSNWFTFQILPHQERQKISTELQAIEQKLKGDRASAEVIAQKKAEYFLNYQIQHQTETGTFNAWSDALQIISEVENPSPAFVQKREEFVASVCTPSQPTARRRN